MKTKMHQQFGNNRRTKTGIMPCFLGCPKTRKARSKNLIFFFHKVSKTNVPNLQIKSALCTFKNRGKKIISKFSQQFLGHPRSTNYEFITFFLHLSSKPEQYTVELGISYSIWGSSIEVFLT